MTASETLKLIAKQWCNLSDLMKLAGVGRNNALVIKSTIKKKLEIENYYVPNNAVPMQEVVNLSFGFLRKILCYIVNPSKHFGFKKFITKKIILFHAHAEHSDMFFFSTWFS